MMKFAVVLFMIVPIKSIGQSWCDTTGANRKHSYSLGSGTVGYVEISYTGDTLINGQVKRKLNKKLIAYNYISSQNLNYSIGNEYTYENNSIVFIRYQNHWDTLYDGYKTKYGNSHYKFIVE